MSGTPFQSLKQTTQAVKSASTADAKAAYLDQAFELFKLETEKLAGAYWNLQKKFEAVNLELQTTNEKLNAKVAELDFATNYLNSIFTQMAQGLLFVDLTGTITTCNKAAEHLLGCKAKNVLMQSFWSHFPDELFGFSLRQALGEKKAPASTFVTLKDRYNEDRQVETSVNFILLDGTQGVIILLRDITELRRLQTVAARNDRLKELGEMAAMVAHEIRNPLGGIKGFASLLERDLKDQPELAKMAGYIIEGTDALNHLVGTVLNYSRPLQLKLEVTDLQTLMRELVEHVQADPTVPANISLKLKGEASPVATPVDAVVIKGAVLNLIVNSIQAMPDGGEVTVAVHADKGGAVIEVADTGIGIPPENMEKLFSPFFTTRPDGNGFGLAEVYKVVQAHGGTIEASSSVGQGTLFTITLPTHIGTQHGN